METSPSELSPDDVPPLPVTTAPRQSLLGRWETAVAVVVIALFAYVNFHNIGRYGMSWDEPAGMGRGRDMAAIISHVFTGSYYSADYFSHSRFHPTFYAFVNYELAGMMMNHSMDPVPAGHVLNLLVATLGLAVLYFLASRLFTPRVGLFSVLFFALYPRFIAHAHFNSKDMPVMVFVLLTVCLMYLAIKSGRTSFWIWAGVAMGVAVSTKLEALMILLFMGAAALMSRIRGYPVNWRNRWPLIMAGTTAVTVFALWPVLWLDPFFLFRAVGFFSGEFEWFSAPYLNQFYMVGHLPWHYTLLHVLAVTPLVTLACAVLGAALLANRIRHREGVFEAALILCWATVPVLIRCLGCFLQYDGMRHVFVIVPALAMIAALGLDWLVTVMSKALAGRIAAVAVSAGAFGWLFVQCTIGHPYQGSYLNEAVRAALPKDKLGHYFDFSSWAVPLQDGVVWLNKNAPPNARIRVMQGDYPSFLIGEYSLRGDITVSNVEGDAPDLIVASSLARIDVPGYKPIFSVKCNGTDLLIIYVRSGNTDWG